MENASIIVITSSEEEKEEGNGSKEKNIELGVAAKSKLDEYKEIADLTGFDNLKAMMLAESLMKRKKNRNRKKKKKKDKTKLESLYREVADLTGFENLKAMIEAEAPMRRKSSKRKRGKLETQFCAQENDTVNVAEEHGQLGEDEGLNKVEEKERNGREEKRRRAKRAKLDEYEKISDLGGFDNLKAMIEAEAFMRRKKRNRKRRKREIEFCGQQDVTVSAEEEKGQLDKNETLKVVEVSKPESVMTSEMDEPWHLVIDPAKENEGASMVEAMKTVRAVGGDDGRNSFEVIDLCLSSVEDDKSVLGVSLERSVEDMGKAAQTTATITGANDGVNCVETINLCSLCLEDDKPISDVSLGRRVDTVSIGPIVGERQQKKRRKKTRVIEAKDKVQDARKENDAKYNVVLRMLLRKPRYFDPPDWNSENCSNCGKENHTAATCKVQKQKKPCFLCGSFKHRWKSCKQGQDYFISKGSEHLANDGPEMDQGNNLSSNICLRCGDSGHDLFSCRGDYLADDLKKIQCYICKSFGHLCCVNYWTIGLKEVSCYNCGQSGHLGPECTNSREALDGQKSNLICYKCGREGHFARKCGGNFKDRLRISDLLSTAERLPARARNFVGSNAIPYSIGNAQGRENDDRQE